MERLREHRVPWHARSVQQTTDALGTDAESGLTAEAVVRHRQVYGPNTLSEAAPVPLWIRLAGQFRDLVIWILIVAALLAGVMGEWINALAILAIVVLNGVIGFTQEERAERRPAPGQILEHDP